ncbi:MAG: CHRD domain-containing protein, partial [Chloroflexota bacterium]
MNTKRVASAKITAGMSHLTSQFVKRGSAILIIFTLLLLITNKNTAVLAVPDAQATQAATSSATPPPPVITNPDLCAPALTRGAAKSVPVASAGNTDLATAEPDNSPKLPAPAIVSSQGCTLASTLKGVGNSKGRGLAVLVLNLDKQQVCYALHITGLKEPVTAVHVHRNSGQVALLLPAPTQGTSEGCMPANRGLMQDMLDNPTNFFVNVHNAEYATGAVQGGLRGAVLLRGAEEVPPADPNGWGAASFILDLEQGKVCYEVQVANIGLPGTADHIHLGKAGATGPTAINLIAPDNTGHASGCADVDADTIKSILDDPTSYYINVHNADFPKSALRGQFPKVRNLALCAPALTRGTVKAIPPAAVGTAEPDKTAKRPAPPLVNTQGGCTLAATLVAAGKVKGGGAAALEFDLDKQQVCYAIQVSGLKTPITAAHVRRNNGQSVLTLNTPTDGASDGCLDVDRSLMQALLDSPANFRVDVSNADFPNGAAQGKLRGAILLRGSEEVPPADPNGWGTASFVFDAEQGKVCYEVQVANITLPGTANHIHLGKAGATGPTAVNLIPPDITGHASGCADVDVDTIQSILDDPTGYYINVHNADFPKSALRGQF